MKKILMPKKLKDLGFVRGVDDDGDVCFVGKTVTFSVYGSKNKRWNWIAHNADSCGFDSFSAAWDDLIVFAQDMANVLKEIVPECGKGKS